VPDCLRNSLSSPNSLNSRPRQRQHPAAPPAATPGLSSSLGVYVFPAKKQTPQTQSNDEASCFGWAKSQTGIDPMAITPQTTPDQPATAAGTPAKGGTVRGAAHGAAGGAAIGAIAGDAGKGAAVGAGVGALTGAAKRRAAKDAAAQQQQQAQASAAQQAQASIAQQKATYNKAFSACMEGKGYTVK
jgi:Glycine-zipper domain